MILKVINLSLYEVKQIVKQSILLLVISSLMLSLALGVFSFSTNLKSNYANQLDMKSPEGFSFAVEVGDLNSFINGEKYVDYIYITARNATEQVILKNNDIEFNTHQVESNNNLVVIKNYSGRAYFFKNYLPNEFLSTEILAGRLWKENDNGKENLRYNIFISDFIADELLINIDDILIMKSTAGSSLCEFTIKGVYLHDNSSAMPYFVIPINYCVDNYSEINNILFSMSFNQTSKILDSYYKLTQAGIYPKQIGNFFNELEIMKGTEVFMLALSMLIVIVSFMILSNLLTLIINSRHDYIAKLKLLGATSDVISLVYYMIFSAIFLFAFVISILLNFLMKGYYENTAQSFFNFTFNITIHWYAVALLFFVSMLLVLVRFFIFRRKISVIKPLDYMRID